MTCTVVTVLHHSGDVVERLVRSLPADIELVAVANGTTDDAAARVASVRPDARIVISERNLGFGGGGNLGASVASAKTLAFLNPDCEVLGDALSVLERHIERHPLDIVAPALVDDAGDVIPAIRKRSSALHETIELLPVVRRWLMTWLPRDLPATDLVYANGGPVDVIQGACMVIARARFAALGGFDEDFFLYSEEESLCERIRNTGGRAWYLPQAVVRHSWGTSTAKRAGFATEHFYRSRIVLYRKRDGTVAAATAALVIGAAAALDALGAVISARSRRDARRTTQFRAALRGLRRGVSEPLASNSFWPAAAQRDA